MVSSPGLKKLLEHLTSTTDELPRIEVKYADLVENNRIT